MSAAQQTRWHALCLLQYITNNPMFLIKITFANGRTTLRTENTLLRDFPKYAPKFIAKAHASSLQRVDFKIRHGAKIQFYAI